jgi:hypothetical protein
MCPIPGNIIGLRVTDIVRYWLRKICHGFAIRPVEVARPDDPSIGSAVMPERSGDRRMETRMR